MRIRNAVVSVQDRGIKAIFRWLPGHKGIPGNEKADQLAKEFASQVGPLENPTIRYLSVIKRILKDRLSAA